MDISNMGGGDFLTAKDKHVGDRVDVVVADEGKIQPAEGEFKAALILGVKYNGKPMSLRLGVKNVGAISQKHGTDTKSWIGKTFSFIVYMTNYQNKLGFQFAG